MAWVRFTADFDFSPIARKGHVTIAYKKGMVKNVTTECATLSTGAGKAERMKKVNRDADPLPATSSLDA